MCNATQHTVIPPGFCTLQPKDRALLTNHRRPVGWLPLEPSPQSLWDTAQSQAHTFINM